MRAQRPAQWNPDASLLVFDGPARRSGGRRVHAPRGAPSGSTLPRAAATRAGAPRRTAPRSKCCRDRSCGTDEPAGHNGRSYTAGQTHPPPPCTTSTKHWTTPCIAGIKAMRRRSHASRGAEGPGFSAKEITRAFACAARPFSIAKSGASPVKPRPHRRRHEARQLLERRADNDTSRAGGAAPRTPAEPLEKLQFKTLRQTTLLPLNARITRIY